MHTLIYHIAFTSSVDSHCYFITQVLCRAIHLINSVLELLIRVHRLLFHICILRQARRHASAFSTHSRYNSTLVVWSFLSHSNHLPFDWQVNGSYWRHARQVCGADCTRQVSKIWWSSLKPISRNSTRNCRRRHFRNNFLPWVVSDVIFGVVGRYGCRL